MAVLHVVLLDSNQNLWHTVRRLDGSWLPFGPVRGVVLSENPGSLNPGPFSDVDCAGAGNDLHICLQTTTDQILHTVRFLNNGRWSPFGDVAREAGAPRGNVRSITATGRNGQLHVGAAIRTITPPIQSTEYQLFHAIRGATGTSWKAFETVGGSFDDTDYAEVNGDIQFCGITYDASGSRHHILEHALRPAGGGPFTPFGDVRGVVLAENPGSLDPGPKFLRVSCTGLPGALHVLAVSDPGRMLVHTIRFAAGNWGPFRDVVADVLARFPGSPRPTGIGDSSCATVNGELHVICVDGAGMPRHTVLQADGTPLFPFGNVVGVVLAENPGSPVPAAIRFVAIADSF